EVGDRDAERRQRELQSRLGHDVVSRRRQRRARRPAEHEARAVIAFEQEREVGAAALADSLRPQLARAQPVLVEEGADCFDDEQGLHAQLGANALTRRGSASGGAASASTPVLIPARPNSASRSRCSSTSPSKKISRTSCSGTSSSARLRSPPLHASASGWARAP